MRRVQYDKDILFIEADGIRMVKEGQKKVEETIEEFWQKEFGGEGSGYHGHSGRPGERGGSSPGGGGKFREVNAKDITKALTKRPDLGEELEFATSRAVNDYTQFGYIRVNNSLRRGKQGEDRQDIRIMDKAMNQETTEGIVVYRGIDSEVLEELRKRDGFRDKGFVSTTTDRTVPERYYSDVIRIEIPRGIKCRWVGWAVGKTSSEKELILERGLKFKWVGGKRGMQDTLRVVKE